MSILNSRSTTRKEWPPTAKKSSPAGWPPPKTPPGGARRSSAICAPSATWPKTALLAYERDLRRFFDWLGGRRIAGLTISELADYPAWLTAQELAPASISRHVVSLKVFFRYLQLEGVLTDNQAELLGTQKLWQRVPTVLSQTEIERAAHGARSRRGPGGGAIGRCSRCCTPPAAACRSFRTCDRATCTGRALLPVPRQRRQAAGRAAGRRRRSRPSKTTLEHERPKLAERGEHAVAVLAALVARRPAAARADLGADQALRKAGRLLAPS